MTDRIKREALMPLAFDSMSHGTVAFGFFNIDSDMLLLDHYFFFADRFCEYISEVARSEGEGAFQSLWRIRYIADSEDIGDLMGAIHGIRYTGFIGDVYRKFPFPEKQEDFKQKPNGFKTQAVMDHIIAPRAKEKEIPFSVDADARIIGVGDYRFDRVSFQNLIKYVWQGGYPRWRNEERPGYVLDMKEKIEASGRVLFKDIVWEP